MKFIYPAVFHEEKDGKYKGYFPDLECCYGEGDTIDDAQMMPMRPPETG